MTTYKIIFITEESHPVAEYIDADSIDQAFDIITHSYPDVSVLDIEILD